MVAVFLPIPVNVVPASSLISKYHFQLFFEIVVLQEAQEPELDAAVKFHQDNVIPAHLSLGFQVA